MDRILPHGGNAEVVRQDLRRAPAVDVSLRTMEHAVMQYRRQFAAEATATERSRQPEGRGRPASHFPCQAQPHPRPPVPGRARLSRRALAAQTPGAGGPALELGDDPPPARRLGPLHHLATRGRRPLDPVPLGLPPGRQSRRTGPGYRPGAGPASHAHQPRGRCHAVTVFHAIIRALDRFCDAITPGLHPQVILFQSLVLSRIQI